MSDPQQQSPDAGGSPDGGGSSAVPPQGGAQQANQLQETLGKLMQLTQTLGQQNEVIQPEMHEIASSLRKAFLKVIQAGRPQPQAPAPPGQ